MNGKQDLREIVAALSLAVLGVGSRLLFVSRFPTLPFSDFQALVSFGRDLRDHGLAAPSNLWRVFNPGLPMALSLLGRVFPSRYPDAARAATAALTGLLPLLPFLFWRGALSFRLRLLAGLLLAAWPGQICFSGVVAQDNWVLMPAVALAALAVRVLLLAERGGHPFAAGLLFAAGVAVRQEMALVLLPPVVAAAFGARPRRRFGRNLVLLALSAGLPLLALAEQRRLATGRFALTTEHGSLALLGTVAPGASSPGWIDPHLWVASVDPDALASPRAFAKAAPRLALREYLRRPRFHLLRVGTQTLRVLSRSDALDLFWGLIGPSALPPERRIAGTLFAKNISGAIVVWQLATLGLFVATVLLGIRRRRPEILVIVAAIFLKVALQAVISPMPRLLLPATALELLVIPLGFANLARASTSARAGLAALAIAVPLFSALTLPALERRLAADDTETVQPIRFPLEIPGSGHVWCRVSFGLLSSLEREAATVRLMNLDPQPGERAAVECRLPPIDPAAALTLRIEDSYARGGFPGRIEQRVEIDGREVFRHDIAAEPGAGWAEIAVPPRALEVEIGILAVRPDPGWGWGTASRTSFEFVRRPRGPVDPAPAAVAR